MTRPSICKKEIVKIKLLQIKENFFLFHQAGQKLKKKVNKRVNTGHEIHNSIKEDIKGSCLWEVMEERSLSREAIKNKEEVQCPILLESAKNILQKKELIILLNFLNLLYLQVNKFSLLKKTLFNKVKAITGSAIGNAELLHQSFTEFSPDLKRCQKQKKVMVELIHHEP